MGEAQFHRLPAAEIRREHDIVVLALPSGNRPFVLDSTAMEIWDRLAVPATVSDIVSELADPESTDTSVAQITADVSAFLSQLVHEGLVISDA